MLRCWLGGWLVRWGWLVVAGAGVGGCCDAKVDPGTHQDHRAWPSATFSNLLGGKTSLPGFRGGLRGLGHHGLLQAMPPRMTVYHPWPTVTEGELDVPREQALAAWLRTHRGPGKRWPGVGGIGATTSRSYPAGPMITVCVPPAPDSEAGGTQTTIMTPSGNGQAHHWLPTVTVRRHTSPNPPTPTHDTPQPRSN
jgi:hypothetical protein